MRAHPEQERLQEYADGELERAELDAVTTHLETCDACRAYVRRVRVLMEDLARLPRALTPARDLRPALPGDPTPHAPREGAGRPTRLWWPAAAALAALLLGYSLARVVWRAGGITGPTPAEIVTTTFPDAEELMHRIDRYEAASRELQVAYMGQRETLPAATAGLMDARLAVVERAIASTAASSRAAPDDELLGHMLLARYEAKVGLLRQAIEVGVGR